MSVSPRRVSFFHVAMLASAVACYKAPSSTPQPLVEPVAQTQQRVDGRTPRHFPGVDLVPTGHSAFVVRIHSGLVGDGEPLYLIDGNPMTISPSTGIDWFKPEDIAQIRVLKYPEELALYGPRGVNGVIVITTKQGLGPER